MILDLSMQNEICLLVEKKYYHEDFTQQERFTIGISSDEYFKKTTTVTELF
jgi:hypothetical protein